MRPRNAGERGHRLRPARKHSPSARRFARARDYRPGKNLVWPWLLDLYQGLLRFHEGRPSKRGTLRGCAESLIRRLFPARPCWHSSARAHRAPKRATSPPPAAKGTPRGKLSPFKHDAHLPGSFAARTDCILPGNRSALTPPASRRQNPRDLADPFACEELRSPSSRPPPGL